MKKVFLLLFIPCISTAMDANSIETADDFYTFLKGSWHSPQNSDIDMEFIFGDNGRFDLIIKPSEALENGSYDPAFREVLLSMQEKSNGDFMLLEFANEAFDDSQLTIHMQTEIQSDITTNLFDIYDNEIYIINPATKEKNLFLTR